MPGERFAMPWRLIRTSSPTPYATVLTRHLRASGVNAWQVSAQLGHKQPGMSTTEIYAPFEPDYLAGAAKILTNYLKELIIPPEEQIITCSLHAHIEARRQAL